MTGTNTGTDRIDTIRLQPLDRDHPDGDAMTAEMTEKIHIAEDITAYSDQGLRRGEGATTDQTAGNLIPLLDDRTHDRTRGHDRQITGRETMTEEIADRPHVAILRDDHHPPMNPIVPVPDAPHHHRRLRKQMIQKNERSV